jgi:hypothetical protein
MTPEPDSKRLDDVEIDRLARALDQELELLLAEAAGPAAPPDEEPVDLTDRVEEPPRQPAARPDEEDDWNQARPAEEVWVEPAPGKEPPAAENAADGAASAPREAPEKARRLSVMTGEELARLIEAAVEKGVTAALAKRRI